jgi:glycosyltransferase involved in cell wall biosynthesis
MRIGLIAPPWLPVPPNGYGGIEAVVNDLAVALTAAGQEVVLAATGDCETPVQRVVTFERARTDATGRRSVEVAHVLEAYAGLGSAGVDLVHDHTVVGPAIAAERPGMPVVTTAHWSLDGDVGRMYRLLGRRVPLIAVSEAQRRLAPHVQVARVIHHGLDVAAVPVGAGDSGRLLVLARMSPDKGVDIAIEVARAAGMPIVVAGPARSTAEQSYFEQCIRPLLGGSVEYVGEVGGRCKQELVGSAVAVLMPACWDEPFGLVAIEALAAGTPVLAFPRGALPEIITDGTTGFLCTDADAMACAVGRVGDLDRTDCRKSVQERFSAVRMAQDHAAFYAQVLHTPGRLRQPSDVGPDERSP